jgi:hypothetical protein
MTSQKKTFDPPLRLYVASVDRTHLFGSRVISKLATSETDIMYIFKGAGGYQERTHKDLDGRRICFLTEKEAYEALIRYVEEDLAEDNKLVHERLNLLRSRIANSEDVDIVLHQTCMKERK